MVSTLGTRPVAIAIAQGYGSKLQERDQLEPMTSLGHATISSPLSRGKHTRRQILYNGRFYADDAPADRYSPQFLGQEATQERQAYDRSKPHKVDDNYRRRGLHEYTPQHGVADAAHFGKGGRDDGR